MTQPIMIEAIRTFILTCPFLQEGKVGIDFLSDKPMSYSIEPVPSTTILKEDILGNTVNQYLFQFSSRESWSESERENINNSGFYEKFYNWLKEQTNTGTFPDFGTNKQVLKIYASGNGFIQSTDAETAIYVIQCGIIYNEEV